MLKRYLVTKVNPRPSGLSLIVSLIMLRDKKDKTLFKLCGKFKYDIYFENCISLQKHFLRVGCELLAPKGASFQS